MRAVSAPVATGAVVRRGRSGPAGVGYRMTQVSDTCTRITGRAYVGEVSTVGKLATNQKQNCLGLVFDINPALLNDRVAVIASTFEKYVYHGVKFTYVPQCATSTPGSVGLVFDRDPLSISANPQSTQFLAEVMSYENAVLTPAYVPTSTAYARDPKELKTWFIGGPDATLTTRETSQGNLLVYVSNAQPATGYGFVVMDYVLDLVAPSIIPNKQNVTAAVGAPGQWQDCNGQAGGVVTNRFVAIGAATAPINASAAANAFWLFGTSGGPTWMTQFGTHFRAGVVGEIHLGGIDTTNGNALATVTNASVFAADSASGVPIVFKAGQKLYFATHWLDITTAAGAMAVSFHTTLSSARAAVGVLAQNQGVGTYTIVPDALYVLNGTDQISVGGWARLINEGSGTEDNA